MQQRDLTLLMLIVLLAAAALWVVWPGNAGLRIALGPVRIERDIKVHRGLDLQGGVQVVLEADMPEGQTVTGESMEAAKTIVENRVNSLGVAEPLVQLAGSNRIVVELPGISEPELAIDTLRETGLLEFVDAGNTFLPPGTVVKTSFLESGEYGIVTPTPEPTVTETAVVTPSPTLTPTVEIFSSSGLEELEFNFKEMLSNLVPGRSKTAVSTQPSFIPLVRA